MSHLTTFRDHIHAAHLMDEDLAVRSLIDTLGSADLRARTARRSAELIDRMRADQRQGLMDRFMAEYGLSNAEGVALMRLAEAMLRVPDAATSDDLIADKLVAPDWSAHRGQAPSGLINVTTRGLELAQAVLAGTAHGSATRRLIARLGRPVIRRAVRAAMVHLGGQFVLGETIEKALRRARKQARAGYTHSFDMLGEAALNEADAARFLAEYQGAITALAGQVKSSDLRDNPGISVKLSALYPRYEGRQRQQVLDALVPRLAGLARQAAEAGIGMNVDAEEADRLDLSLDVIEAVLSAPELAGWDGFGIVVQAYSKRAPFVIDWLDALARRLDRKIMVRLVKGASWDTEIKRSQVEGLSGYPVFTRKSATDISYLACARRLLGCSDRIYPQFATHNAHTVQSILDMAPADVAYEFQRLHGMGDVLFSHLLTRPGLRCRIYAPVGSHDTLLAYLVRRMLENGANGSFVHQIMDSDRSSAQIAADPVETWLRTEDTPIPAPCDLFAPERTNSVGFDLNDPVDLKRIARDMNAFSSTRWQAAPVTAVPIAQAEARALRNPARTDDTPGYCSEATGEITTCIEAAATWDATPKTRAAVLHRAADLYEDAYAEIFALLAREAGKSLPDGVAELREAVDFLRYYAARNARLSEPARGRIVAISPWNFPLAIFAGQIAAALSAGNAVLAKPAEQTPLVAALATRLLHKAGVPVSALQLLPGKGHTVGAALCSDPRIDGVCFTGSTATAQAINGSLVGARPMFIAETGGLNAMMIDSTALPEQAVRDVVASAFQSAGQRCSALRMLYVQEDVADRMFEMLIGAARTQRIGDPWQAETDIGPLIDKEAADYICAYIDTARRKGRVVYEGTTPEQGHFVPPTIISVDGIGDLGEEIFGPVLHVATYNAANREQIINDIQDAGYGLTFGLQTRIDARADRIATELRVGNIYVNRNQIGAIVGSQPFGGEGLSGTGPKAGGPDYLPHFTQPQTAPVVHYPTPSLTCADVQAEIDATELPDQAVLRHTDLPGPTGERNQLTTHARGRVLCLGPTREFAEAQAAAVRMAGAVPVIIAPGPQSGLDGALDPGDLEHLTGFAAVVLWTDDVTTDVARRALARRDGQILPLITDMEIASRVVVERHVCTDTTAAGGNVALLAAAM